MGHLHSWGGPPGIYLRWLCCLLVAAIVLELPTAAWAITFPQADDFQDGTTRNWTNGAGGQGVTNIASGGPGGATDKFLQVSSGDFPARPRFVTFNITQWIGDYNLAGVSAIGMDLKYVGVGDPMVDVQPIRIALFDPINKAGYASNNSVAGGAFSLPNDGAWHHWTFALTSSAMTAVNTTNTLAQELSNPPQLRILSSAAPSGQGDFLSVDVGIDNITAVPTLIAGDLNRDSHFNVSDIQAMATALTDLSGYQAYWGLTSDQLNTLANFDTVTPVTNTDLQGLINALANAGGGSISAVPEPAALVQSMVGVVLLVVRMRTGRFMPRRFRPRAIGGASALA